KVAAGLRPGDAGRAARAARGGPPVIGLFRSQPSLPRRLAGELVPALAGALAGELSVALLARPLAVALGVLVWVLASGVLAWVRTRPRLRTAYRLALLAHLLFWSWQGYATQRLAAPQPPGPAEVAGWDAAQPFLAGVAEASFDARGHGTLAGWGQRPRRLRVPPFLGLGPLGRAAQAWMGAPHGAEGLPRAPLFAAPAEPGEALGARALVLRPAQGGPPLVLVRLDLTTSDPWLVDALRARLAGLGVVAPLLLVSATHTHSGLGGYARDGLGTTLALDHFDPEVFDAVVTAAAAAVERAHALARPARMAVARARDRGADGVPILARRRSGAAFDDIDDRVLALRIEADEGRTLALVVNHAVHATAVRRDTLAFDRDIVGAVEEQLGWRLPGHPLVLFVNGALGDVAPRVARTPQRPEALREAGERFADAVTPALLEPAARGRLRVQGARVERDLGSPHAFATLGARSTWLEEVPPSPFDGPPSGVAGDLVLLPANALLWSLTLTDVRLAGSLGGTLGVQLSLRHALSQPRQPAGALLLTLEGESGEPPLRLPLLWVTGEPSTAVGRAWREAFAEPGGALPMVLGCTNGSMAYITSAEEQHHASYEAMATLFGQATEALLTEMLRAARGALR
ncbi:MAG: neutral/alkaline non-lysosomal ceramidase N-terminal domain-containing protein, partial [Planctomycetia bacterium]